jgi:AraC family transcriptional regulator, activator of mtrCDE
VSPLPGTLDGAIERLALCEIGGASAFADEGAPTITLHCVLSGETLAQIGDTPVMTLEPGSALLLQANTRLRLWPADPDAPVRVLMGRVSGIAATSLGLTATCRLPLIERLEATPEAARLLAKEMDQPGLGVVLVAAALMKLYLVEAARGCADDEPVDESRIGKAVTTILANPGAAHSIAALAERTGMSRATFMRHFSRATGMNPMQFVAKARLDHAAELLRTTQLPIKTVAAQIGFGDRSHFSRAFRRAHGVDPSSFRRTTEG